MNEKVENISVLFLRFIPDEYQKQSKIYLDASLAQQKEEKKSRENFFVSVATKFKRKKHVRVYLK